MTELCDTLIDIGKVICILFGACVAFGGVIVGGLVFNAWLLGTTHPLIILMFVGEIFLLGPILWVAGLVCRRLRK